MMHMSRISYKVHPILFLLVHLFFTVSWSQVYLSDYLPAFSAIARWGALDCPRVWLGEDAWEGCATVGRLWVTGMPPGMIPSTAAGSPPGATPTMPGGYLYVAPLSSGWIACWSITDQGADVTKNSLFTQFLKLSGMRPRVRWLKLIILFLQITVSSTLHL